MKCVDQEYFTLNGDFNSNVGSQFNAQFVRCTKESHPEIDCHSEEEITDFIRGKFILLLFNELRFDSRYYSDEAIIKESRVTWVPINSQIRQTIPYKVSTTQLFLQDEAINLDELTELEDTSVFTLDQLPLKPYEHDLYTQVDITVEMNLDQKVIARAGYTFLDLLSDIGGMQGVLMSGMAYLLTIWNYNYFDNYMVTRLYKMEKEDADKQGHLTFWRRSSFVWPRKFYNPKEFICDTIPKKLRCCSCCRPDRKERYFEAAREELLKESNIIELIKERRYFKRALKVLLTHK